MNGSSETKSIILSRIADKLDDMDKSGWSFGKVLAERDKNVCRSLDELRADFKSLSSNVTKGIIAVIILAAIAGANLLEAIVKLVLK